MDNIFEELNKIYENENIPTLLDMVECSTIVIVPDAREFTHLDAERVAQRFNYSNDLDEEDIDEELESPLKGKNTEKFIVSKDEVKAIINRIVTSSINLIRNKETVNGRKNVLFMQEHDLTEEDISYLTKQLKVSDYSYSSNSRNINFPNSILTFFITNKNFILPSGKKFDALKVYIKIDATDDGYVTVVSFHDATGNIKHPYTDEDSEV